MNSQRTIRDSTLFQGLSDHDLGSILKISDKIDIEEGNYFIHEGEKAENFYFILSGRVAIIKSGSHGTEEHVITCLESGDTVGEMALLDNKCRSASAKAITPCELLRFPYHTLKAVGKQSALYDQIIQNIYSSITNRLDNNNTTVVTALEKQLEEYKMRVGLGTFMINNIVALCLFSFCLSWITSKGAEVVASTVISLPLTLAFVVLFFSIIKSTHLPLRTFGLTILNWRKAMAESIFFTVMLCITAVMLKWILIHTVKSYMHHSLFEPYLTINIKRIFYGFPLTSVWWIVVAIYSLLISPLQELIVRGGLQGPLEVFLTGKYTPFKAIVVSNLMFSTTHLFLGFTASMTALIFGLYFGWLYSRHHTLVGVIFAHALIGTWASMIVGF